MLDPYDPDARRRGTLLISNSPFGGVDTYVEAYRNMVKYELDPIALSAAIQALARHGTPGDAPLIAGKLSNESEQVRWEAAKGLQRLHNPVIVPELLRTLRNEDEATEVRVSAGIALGQYPQDRVFQGLVGALTARELSINVAAAESLEMLTGQAWGIDAMAWYEWYNGAEFSGSAFVDQQDFVFPTYQRDVTVFEKMVFWNPKRFEEPAHPAGLLPDDTRSTYVDTGDAQ